jgi:gluconokinase
VDYSLASGSALFNVQTLSWDSQSLQLAGIKPNQLSHPAAPSTTFRGIAVNMAEAMGIPPDVLVVLGSSDAANSNFGAGATESWQATCMVGTSGAFRIITPKPLLDPAARTWCYAIDETHWLVGGAINNGGIAFSWLKDTLNQANAQFGIEKQVSFDELIALAAQAKPGSGGVLCLPYFAGERSPYWNLNARAAFFGMTLNHDLRHLARALLEGVAFRLRSLSEILSEISGDIREVRASGGFTHSALWPQIIASTLGRDLLLPAWGETSALGAAFWAMLGAGALPALDRVNDFVSIQAKYNPVLEETKVYDRLYPIYSGLYQSLCVYFDQIAQFQE